MIDEMFAANLAESLESKSEEWFNKLVFFKVYKYKSYFMFSLEWNNSYQYAD